MAKIRRSAHGSSFRLGLGLGFAALFAMLGALTDATPSEAATKRVACALPYVVGGPNFFCSAIHQILFFTDGYTSNESTITAQLEARDQNGNVLLALPVHAGDFARLTAFKNSVTLTQRRNLFNAVAPVIFLHVTADDGQTKTEAFCSPTPFLTVIEPNNSVTSLSEGDVTKVSVAIPGIDPSQLVVLIDGVDVFDALGIGNPATCTPAAPCSGGPFLVNGQPVTVSDLIVDGGPIGSYAANMLTMSVSGLGCGGHLFSFDSAKRPDSLPRFVSPTCQTETEGIGISSGFGVTVTKPTPSQAALTFPVEVQGTVCSGQLSEDPPYAIGALKVNGKSVPTAGQVLTPGNGTTTTGSVTLPFTITLDKTDLADDISTGTAIGTYDLGTNRVVAAAKDVFGNRAYSSPFLFATGVTLNPGITLAPAFAAATTPAAPPAPANALATSSGPNAALAQSLRESFTEAIKKRFTEQARSSALEITQPAAVDLQDGLVIGLSAQAIQDQFTQRCKDPVNGIAVQFANKVVTSILSKPPKNDSVANPCLTCGFSIDFTTTVTGASVPNPIDNITCTATLSNGNIHIQMDLPSVIVDTHTGGSCGAIPVDGYEIDMDIRATISGVSFSFDISANQIKNATTPDPNATVYVEGNLNAVSTGGSGLTAYGVCAVFNLVVQALTFGLVDLTPDIDIHIDQDFTKQIGNSQPDPPGVCDMNVAKDTSTYNGTVEGKLADVTITPAGLRASLTASIGALDVNPARITPGAVITTPPLPTMPFPGSSDATVLLNIDAMNLLFAALSLGDKLETQCVDSNKTLGDILPADCDSIASDAGPSAQALAQGVCHGIRLADCEQINVTDPDPQKTLFLTALKQGACHGTKGDNCSQIPVVPGKPLVAAAERGTCNITPDLNLKATDRFLICTLQDIPPRVLPTSTGGATPVSSTLRLNNLSVGLILDREGTLVGELGGPKCFSKDTDRSKNCNLFEACLGINYNFDLSFQTCTDGRPGIFSKFKSLQLRVNPGVICDGAGLEGADELTLTESQVSDSVKDTLPKKAEDAAPPLCTKGLDLSGLVNCQDPKLIAIGTAGDPTFKDWLGITCTAGPPTVAQNQPPRDCQ